MNDLCSSTETMKKIGKNSTCIISYNIVKYFISCKTQSFAQLKRKIVTTEKMTQLNTTYYRNRKPMLLVTGNTVPVDYTVKKAQHNQLLPLIFFFINS